MLRQVCATMAIFTLGMFSAFGAQKQSSGLIDVNAPIERQVLLMDYGWKFHLGNSADPNEDFGYETGELFAKEGIGVGAIKPDFNDSSWQTVDLPHDWAVYLPFVDVNDFAIMGHGYKPLGGKYPATSIGWYRRTFTIPAQSLGKRITIKFDGVFRDCTVWLNGNFVGRNLSGYSEFLFDITNFIHYGKKNILVVRVNATNYEGWFYEGAGIYRHVWLIETAPLHIPVYGTYVRTTSLNGNNATLAVETKVSNRQYRKRAHVVMHVLLIAFERGAAEKGHRVGLDHRIQRDGSGCLGISFVLQTP